MAAQLHQADHPDLRIATDTISSGWSATGVRIQLLYNNQPVLLGYDVTVGTSSSAGDGLTVPLKARNYQTGNDITTGTENGVLSFTMTYQQR
ncbi:fimbrial protein [Salmonella enterica subsp. enterica]